MPESEKRTPTLIASPLSAAAAAARAVERVASRPHADRRPPTAVVPSAAAPARLSTSRRVVVCWVHRFAPLVDWGWGWGWSGREQRARGSVGTAGTPRSPVALTEARRRASARRRRRSRRPRRCAARRARASGRRRAAVAAPSSDLVDELGASPSVGSSSSSSCGRRSSARAIATCCCWPPERTPARRRSSSSRRPGNSSNGSKRGPSRTGADLRGAQVLGDLRPGRGAVPAGRARGRARRGDVGGRETSTSAPKLRTSPASAAGR